jgi:hypothetical protein
MINSYKATLSSCLSLWHRYFVCPTLLYHLSSLLDPPVYQETDSDPDIIDDDFELIIW